MNKAALNIPVQVYKFICVSTKELQWLLKTFHHCVSDREGNGGKCILSSSWVLLLQWLLLTSFYEINECILLHSEKCMTNINTQWSCWYHHHHHHYLVPDPVLGTSWILSLIPKEHSRLGLLFPDLHVHILCLGSLSNMQLNSVRTNM